MNHCIVISFFSDFPIEWKKKTNALASNQRRKIKGYGDFKRTAVIIIPNDDTYKERCDQQAAADKSTVSDNAVTEMKGN